MICVCPLYARITVNFFSKWKWNFGLTIKKWVILVRFLKDLIKPNILILNEIWIDDFELVLFGFDLFSGILVDVDKSK